jgi:hypothetical protein
MNRTVCGGLLFWSLSVVIVLGSTNAPIRDLGVVRTYGETAKIFDQSVRLADLYNGIGHFLLNSIERCRSNAAAKGRSPQSNRQHGRQLA